MKVIKYVSILLLIALLLFFFFKNVNVVEVLKITGQVSVWYPLAFIAGLLLQFFLRSYRWGIILKPHKANIPLTTLYKYTAIGFFLNILPGRVGEPARGILLARSQHFKKSYGLASVVLERLIDSLTLVVVFLLSLAMLKGNPSPFLARMKTVSLYILPFIVLVFVMFYFLNSSRVFDVVARIIRFFAKAVPKRFRDSVVEFALNFMKGLKLELGLVDYLKLVVASLAVWLVVVPFYWILMKGFAMSLNLLEATIYFGIVAASAAIPTPGMAGSLDAGSKLALTQIFSVPAATAVAYTLLFHFAIILVTVVTGLWAVSMEGLSVKSLKKIGENTDEMS